MESFRTFQDIEVKLVGAVAQPYETAVASARTCYSGKGIVYPEQVSVDEKAIILRDRIASSTLEAGHLTTRQHAHFVFAISGISRQCIWSFLHSHPFYNSEQVSQRYVRVKRGGFVAPPLSLSAQKRYEEAVDQQMSTYESLIHALKIPLSTDFFDRFKARKHQPEKWNSSIDKRAYEVARYVLGVGTTAYLYHTVSVLTLLRYVRLSREFETPTEQRILIDKMLGEVKAFDPLLEKEIQDPIPLEETLEYRLWNEFAGPNPKPHERFVREFDTKLEGKISKLISATPDAESVLAHAARVMLGRTQEELPTAQAIEYFLDPKHNRLIGDTLNTATFDRLSQVLHHVSFTFHKKISHTADSQDQRHRTVPASRPLLFFHYFGKPDYVVPFGITQSTEATELYQKSMEKTFTAINDLLSEGVTSEFAFYLLPNAFPIRMVSTGDLHSLTHKWKLRTCYNAQEEIFRASIDEIQQVRELYPALAEHLRAPCYLRLRAGTKPYCPEGDRFCGLPVWKYDINQYDRKSL